VELFRRVQTNKRTPIPAKTTLAGENTCQVNMRVQNSDEFTCRTYQTNALSKGRGEGVKDIHSRVEPFCESILASSRVIELMDLLVKDSENGARRVACLQLGGEWMCEKILLCTPLVRFQCIMEYYLKVGR
jgi:hypothetical protein